MNGMAFHGAMVQAILQGRKDTTRRMAKMDSMVLDKEVSKYLEFAILDSEKGPLGVAYYPAQSHPKSKAEADEEIAQHPLGHTIKEFLPGRNWFAVDIVPCPFYAGQRFFVKEEVWQHADYPFVVFKAAANEAATCDATVKGIVMNRSRGVHEAIEIAQAVGRSERFTSVAAKDMILWQSRCLIEVTGVELQRLGRIESDGIMREGIIPLKGGGYAWEERDEHGGKPQTFTTPLLAFENLWNTCYSTKFNDNPPVWSVRFRHKYLGKNIIPEFAVPWFDELDRIVDNPL